MQLLKQTICEWCFINVSVCGYTIIGVYRVIFLYINAIRGREFVIFFFFNYSSHYFKNLVNVALMKCSHQPDEKWISYNINIKHNGEVVNRHYGNI